MGSVSGAEGYNMVVRRTVLWQDGKDYTVKSLFKNSLRFLNKAFRKCCKATILAYALFKEAVLK